MYTACVKNEALLRFLEVEDFDAAIIFARTKTGTLDITELLEKMVSVLPHLMVI